MSVSERNSTPTPSNSSRSTRKFSTIPLWTTTKAPVASQWGWALRSDGTPWVAQRVWPIPARPRSGASSRRATSRSSLPSAFETATPPLWATATPAES